MTTTTLATGASALIAGCAAGLALFFLALGIATVVHPPRSYLGACGDTGSGGASGTDLPGWYLSSRLDAIERRQGQIELRLDAQRRAERYERGDYPEAEDEPPQRPWQTLRAMGSAAQQQQETP